MSRLFSLWRNLMRRDRVERDLDDEMRATLDLLIAERLRSGRPPDAARREALLELGGVESVKAQVRDIRVGALADAFLQDFRYAVRLLRRNPLFTLTAALSLAIGIGATTSIFTVANGLLFRAAEGVLDPGGLVELVRREPNSGPGVEKMSYPDVLDVRRHATTLDAVYAYQLQLSPVSLRFADGTTPAFANLVTANYFRAVGVSAAAGRVFDAGDSDQAGASPVAVLSHQFWMRRFNGDRGIVGQTVRIDDVPLTVVGVAAANFKGVSVGAPDIWLPVSMVEVISPEGRGRELTSRSIPWLIMGARLKPGVSRRQASAQVAAIGAGIQQETRDEALLRPLGEKSNPLSVVWSAEIASPIPYGLRSVAAGFLTLLITLVAVVLVIACANLAGVLLARATGRRREMAVRAAVGAARVRIVRQLLTETVLLFALGGAAGIAVARALTTLLVSLLPEFAVPVSLSVPLDGTVVAFALALSFVAAVLSGLAPALHTSKSDVVSALKDDAQGPSDPMRLRNAFVVAQVAFSILLVVTAGLLVRAFDNIVSVSRGFDARGVDVASLDLTRGGYTDTAGREMVRRVLTQVRAFPGIESATAADRVPGPGGRSYGPVTVPGAFASDGQPSFSTAWTLVESDYFRTVGIPVIAGRDFTDRDREGAELVAIVGQATAQRLWPGSDAVGRLVLVPSADTSPGTQPRPLRIVGVVGDLVFDEQGEPTPLALYVPLQQKYLGQVTILARRSPDQPSMAETLRATIASVDPRLPVFDVQALEKGGDGPVETQLRIAATVAGSVGIVGLLLAAIGIYGVTAYAVTQRTREIGIRLALGAGRGEVVRLVLRQGMTLVVIGSAIGLAMSLAAGRTLSGRSFGIPQADPATLVAAVVLFAIVGFVACYVPVRRAASIRAMEALRYE